MAATAPPQPQLSHETPNGHSPSGNSSSVSVKGAAFSSDYYYSTRMNDSCAGLAPGEETIPVIDFSFLTSGDPHQRSIAVKELEIACRDWGFFMLVNHSIPESAKSGIIEACKGFFDLPLEEKMKYAGRDVWDPIRAGTGVDVKIQEVSLWRDFLKLFVHPEHNSPSKPEGLSEAIREYSKNTRALIRELLKGVSETLGLEQTYIEKTMDFDNCFQLFGANLYPRCPNPELAIGIPSHADHGLLTVLIQNGVDGLQILHDGKWLNVNPLPNSVLINTGDQLEILSNGKYKSVHHRAVVNDKVTRISVAIAHGPPLDKVIAPSPEFLEKEGCGPAFKPLMYKEFINLQQKNRIDKASPLDQLRLPVS